MSDWKPDLYLTFGRERTRPAVDLAARIEVDNPKRIIDVGCGPGNSALVLKARWPDAEIVGLDSSEAMINRAKSEYPGIEWICADASGDLTGLGKFDVVFSNAAIQWMPDQEALLPRLFALLKEGGAFAAQIPDTDQMPSHTELMKLVSAPKWKSRFTDMAPAHLTRPAAFYYDNLCGLTGEIDLWETRYFHLMNTHAEIVKWYSGSGLRPYLDCLKDSAVKTEFIKEYENALKIAYPIQSDGRILFPFTRIFFIAINRTV